MELRNRFINKALLGLLLGIIVGVAFWVTSDAASQGAGNTELIIHLVMSGWLGLIAMGGSVVYEIESWGLCRATIVHYSLTMADFVLVSLLLKWFPDWSSLLIMLLIMTVIYALIWFGEMLYWKKTVRKINKQLEDIRENEKQE